MTKSNFLAAVGRVCEGGFSTHVSALVAAFVFMAIPSLSSAAVINFAGFPEFTVLTTQDFGDGVTFAGAEILTCCVTDGSGTLNNAQFPPPADDGGSTDGVNVAFNPSGPLTLNFTSPTSFFTADFTYSDGLTVKAYNASATLIDTVNGACGVAGSGGKNFVGSGCGAPNEMVNISTSGISQIVITGGSSDNFSIDDVNFTGAINAGKPGGTNSIPEPGSITILLGGLGCLAAFAGGRRRTHC